MAAPQPLRVLCLAGFRQSERGFREKTGALRKALRGRAELVCLSGPHPIVDPAGAGPESGSCPPEEQPRGWWFSEQGADVFSALEEPAVCRGLEEALGTVAQALNVLGPFDGLLGFSLGAALAALESMQLASRFTGSITLTHSGGHFIPAAASQRQAYLKFLDQFAE
ncbi:PREDICTED: ovarian cancer-associated gene 2 protein [Myotis brandtii]|uniref:ovarian cancer-associated gene 2 protein n=1 Tax=Myotis brandtii TaxID=109478 RepID=UPI00070436A1|nr:PREDICTED: ovarian cancer-associated gene 2 protein [Myotis brandtii]